MKNPVRLFAAVTIMAAVAFAWPADGTAQADSETTFNASQPTGWNVSFSPRVGYFLPRRIESGNQAAPHRPTFGMELVVTRAGSWYGARALFERSASWTPQRELVPTWLPGGAFQPDGSPEPRYFETVVVDAMFYGPGTQGVRPYMFSGVGSKVIGSPDGTPILPYSLVGAERAQTWHGGLGVEAAASGVHLFFEVGDYYGRNGGEDRVHDFHVTLMARLGGIGRLVRTLVQGDDSDG